MNQFQTEERSGAQSGIGEKMTEASQVVSSQAGEAIDKGKGAMTEMIGQRSSQLGDQIGSVSETARRVAEQARLEGNAQHSRLAEQAADRGERLSSYLRDVEPDRLLSDVEDFARREPWVVAGVGLFIGLALARSLKASSGRRYAARDTHRSRYQGNGAAAWSASPGAPRAAIAESAAQGRTRGERA